MSERAVTVFYDFVDPLSYLLLREIEGLEVRTAGGVTWHPFELRPPPTPLVAVDDASLADRWVEARSVASGRGLTFDPPRLVPWTRKAHELVIHAGEHELRDEVRSRVFEAYMLERRDIGRVDVLVSLARDLGLDDTATRAVLDVDRHQEDVVSLRTEALADHVADTPTLVHPDGRLQGFHNRDRLGTLLGTRGA